MSIIENLKKVIRVVLVVGILLTAATPAAVAAEKPVNPPGFAEGAYQSGNKPLRPKDYQGEITGRQQDHPVAGLPFEFRFAAKGAGSVYLRSWELFPAADGGISPDDRYEQSQSRVGIRQFDLRKGVERKGIEFTPLVSKTFDTPGATISAIMDIRGVPGTEWLRYTRTWVVQQASQSRASPPPSPSSPLQKETPPATRVASMSPFMQVELHGIVQRSLIDGNPHGSIRFFTNPTSDMGLFGGFGLTAAAPGPLPILDTRGYMRSHNMRAPLSDGTAAFLPTLIGGLQGDWVWDPNIASTSPIPWGTRLSVEGWMNLQQPTKAEPGFVNSFGGGGLARWNSYLEFLKSTVLLELTAGSNRGVIVDTKALASAPVTMIGKPFLGVGFRARTDERLVGNAQGLFILRYVYEWWTVEAMLAPPGPYIGGTLDGRITLTVPYKR